MNEGAVWHGQNSLGREIGRAILTDEEAAPQSGERDKRLGKCPIKSYVTLID